MLFGELGLNNGSGSDFSDTIREKKFSKSCMLSSFKLNNKIYPALQLKKTRESNREEGHWGKLFFF